MRNEHSLRQWLRRTVLVAALVAWAVGILPVPASAQNKPDVSINVVPFVTYVDAQAGKDNTFSLELRNTTLDALPPLTLSAEKPEGWVVTFDRQEIPAMARKEFQTVKVNIHPPSNTLKGSYDITVIATGTDIQRMQTVQVRVKFASHWLWIILGAAAIVIAAFAFIFWRAGRRG